MKKKKYIIMIACLVIFLLLLLFTIFLLTRKSSKSYDIESIKEQSTRYYDSIGLRVMDNIDMSALFGISIDDVDNTLFMSNISVNEVKSDMVMLIVINSNNSKYYYDVFQSYIDSSKYNIEDDEILQLYNNAILTYGNNYVYMIISSDAKTMEKEINLLYK